MERKQILGIEENSAVYVDLNLTKGIVELAIEPSETPKIPFTGVSLSPQNTRHLIRVLRKAMQEIEREARKIILFFNNSEEDGKAYRLLRDSGIPCEFLGPASGEPCLDEKPSRPLLVVGFSKYVGFEEIEKFVKDED